MPVISYPSPRVSQLDAYILDSELGSLLTQQLADIFRLHNSWWTYDQHPELWSLFLNLVIFKLTVWKTGSSYGLSLQNLKLTDTKKNLIISHSKRALLLSVIVGNFIYNRLTSYLYADNFEEDFNQGSSHKESIIQFFRQNRTEIVSKVTNAFKVLSFLNFLTFLINGNYPSLVHRALRISLTPVINDLLKFSGNHVNYEFQNRQLVWNVMTEFLVFIIPLMQLKKVKRLAHKVLFHKSDDKGNANSEVSAIETVYSKLPISECAICHVNNDNRPEGRPLSTSTLVTNPYITNCGHIFCYICIASKFNAMQSNFDNGDCPRCGLKLTWFRENDSDIVYEAATVSYDSDENESEPENENEEVKTKVKEKGTTDPDNDSSLSDSNKNNFSKPSESFQDDDSDYSEGEEYDVDELM